MNFPNDNSTQSGIVNVSYTPIYANINNPNILFNDLKSGIYNPSQNTIRFFTNNTDALRIDSNQCLYGNGTGLTNLGYVNIINKPTNFQSDWDTTVINKPSTFPSTWGTLANKPTNFQSDWNTTVINRPDLTVYATTINLNNLSTNSTLSINNLNATSTTIFNNLNALSTNSILSINNLNATSTTIFNNLNSLSTNSTLSINNLNATSTTIFNNLNALSTNSTLSINNLNATSTTIFNNLNALSTNSILSINNLNATSTTIFNNLNSLSTNSILGINNLNATSTTIFNNLNSLSTNSTLNISNLNATSTTLFNKTAFGTLYVTGNTTLQNNSTCVSSLNVSGTTTLSNNTTINGLLNVTGAITGSGSGLTNLNYNNIFNPPTIPNFNNAATFLSSLNVSGNTTLQGFVTCLSTLTGTTINANTALRVANNLVNDFCFNNLGFNHADITDFNAPVGFGCRFIFGNTNGPSVPYGSQTSSYTLFMGLGINYPASGNASYGCQLALPRNVGNPTLSVRYKENNAWSGWSAITAGLATALNGTATFTVNVWHRSNDNQQRLYFENNTTTFIQGQGTFPIIFRNNANADIGSVSSTGIINANLKLQEAGVDISTKYLSLSGGTLTGVLNFTGNNSIKFDNTFNEKKIEMSTTSGMGLATNGLVFYSSGAFTFKNTALTTLYSVGSDGSMSTNGTMYPAGGVSSAGNITSFGTLAGVSITEGGTALASKYVLLNGTNNMTGNLNIVNSGSDRSLRISATSIEALSANGSANRLLVLGNGGGIAMGGFISYGITTARHAIDMYNASILIRGPSEASQAILYICNPYLQDSALKTAIIAQGISSWSRSKLHFCNNNNVDNTTSATVSDARMTIDTNGYIGANNTSPIGMLTVGNSALAGSDGHIIVSKRDDVGGNRHFKIGYTPGFSAVIGDCGGNNAIGTMVNQFRILYTAPVDTLVCYGDGAVGTKNGNVVSTSDERLKTDIYTIENALEKTLLLRGVNYTLIQEQTKSIGLIAQEVELIVPEVVHEYDGIKAIAYSNMVGLLVEAIKEQQKQINELRNILIKNNLS